MSAAAAQKRIAFVQTHHTNLRPGDHDPMHYSVGPLRESGLFDHIVLAAADLPENAVVLDWAASWQVDALLGDPLDLSRRMLQVAERFGAGTLARVLVDWFYVDVPLLGRMVERLERADLDYLGLARDFDMKFGADVHGRAGLEKLAALLGDHAELAERYRFRPWPLLEANPDDRFRVELFDDLPLYSNETFERLRASIAERCPIAWDFGPTFYHHAYRIAVDHLPKDAHVLDLACGWGNGTEILAGHCETAIGMDIREGYVEEARRRSRHPNVRYAVGDALDIAIPAASLDAVVSIHTMEHVSDDARFLREAGRVLRRDGLLFLEVPLRMRRPFVGTEKPFMLDHDREYRMEPLRELMESHFEVEACFGVSRGDYVRPELARNAAAFICRNVA